MMPFLANFPLKVLSMMRPLPVGVTKADFTLASFPKSGNTWFRFVFAHLIEERAGTGFDVDFHSIEQFSPAVGGRLGPQAALFAAQPLARPIKTHYNWCNHYAQNRSVLLVRDPLACLPGFYGYLAEAHGIDYGDVESFLASWRHGLPSWIAFQRSWMKRADYILRYEDLLKEPEHWFGGLSAHFGFDYDETEIVQAIERSSRGAMKQAEEKGDPYHERGYTFVRSEGEVRTKGTLDGKQRQEVMQLAGELYATLQSGPRVR